MTLAKGHFNPFVAVYRQEQKHVCVPIQELKEKSEVAFVWRQKKNNTKKIKVRRSKTCVCRVN